jgi:hypothetical protein
MPRNTKIYLIFLFLGGQLPPDRSPKNAGTIHFMSGRRFGVSQSGSEDGLRGTLSDFFIK